MSMVWILAELVDVRHPDTLFHKKVMVRVFRRSHDETTWVPGKVVYLCDQGFAPQKARILFVSGNRRAVYEKKVLSGMQESYMAEIMYRCHRTVSELRSNSQVSARTALQYSNL
uniref:SFRICE_035304 n=1 Tax=Spodoptera frugiperda TaxID=7108 RepID=A0A2H1WEK1_SPOFR